MEAVQQKVSLSQQLDQWQQDVQVRFFILILKKWRIFSRLNQLIVNRFLVSGTFNGEHEQENGGGPKVRRRL